MSKTEKLKGVCMLVLSEKELLESVTLDEVMDSIEDAFRIYVGNDFFMPDRVHIDHGQKTLLYMPCIAGGLLGTKYLTLFPENIPKSLPTIYGLMILNDYETGRPLCILDGKVLTALRTGAVGGTGIKHTTPNTVSTVGLIGAGVQGYYQLMYATHVRSISTIYIYDRDAEKLLEYADTIRAMVKSSTKVEICANVTDLLQKSEVIITTTTANNPVLPDDASMLKGKHFIGIGSYKPSMREYPPAICEVVDNLFIDVELAKEETGDIAQPLKSGILTEDRIRSFGEYMLHGEDKESVKNSTTFFKSVGMALFDVVIADLIYKKALKNNIGHNIDM